MKAYLALGSNIGDREAHLSFGREKLEMEGIEIVAASTVQETVPIGGPKQSHFLNQVLEVETDHQPSGLLEVIKRIETEAGRKAGGERWGPRELDIDILIYGHVTINTPELTIPHPQLTSREFLLRGLKEITPNLTDALSGVTTDQLMRELELVDDPS